MLSIGEAAARSGLPASTIRYYEDEGLLTAPPHRKAGRRFYDGLAMAELALLQDLRFAGMTLADIRQFQNARQDPGASCSELAALAQERARHLRAEIMALRRAEERLMGFARSCTSRCGDGPSSDCSQVRRISVAV